MLNTSEAVLFPDTVCLQFYLFVVRKRKISGLKECYQNKGLLLELSSGLKAYRMITTTLFFSRMLAKLALIKEKYLLMYDNKSPGLEEAAPCQAAATQGTEMVVGNVISSLQEFSKQVG